MTDQDRHVLKIQRRVAALPDKVFEAWTRPDLLARWWGPEGLVLSDYKFDVREGGHWRTVMKSSQGIEHIATGVYKTIDPPYRLVMSWVWEKNGMPGAESEVIVTLEAIEGGTWLTLVHQSFATTEARDAHERGWISHLIKLERLYY